MKRRAILVLCLFACAGLNAQSSRADNIARRSAKDAFSGARWITHPSGGSITVVGIAGRKGRRDEAVQDALLDAARRVSLYHGVYGESRTVFRQGANNADYYAGTDYSLTIHSSAESLLDALVFNRESDVFEQNGSVFVRARYSPVTDIPAYTPDTKEAVPRWVRDYAADVPGFCTAVGMSRNKGSPQKTYQASYENAIVSLLPRLSSSLEQTIHDTEGATVTQGRASSSGSLAKVMILETWFDRDTSSVWTLLVGKPD